MKLRTDPRCFWWGRRAYSFCTFRSFHVSSLRRMDITKRVFSPSGSPPTTAHVVQALKVLGLYRSPSSSSPGWMEKHTPSSIVSDASIKEAFQQRIKLYHPDVATCAGGALASPITSPPNDTRPLPGVAPPTHSTSSSTSITPPSPYTIQEMIEAYQLLRRLSVTEREHLLTSPSPSGTAPRSSSVFCRKSSVGSYTKEEYERVMRIYRGYPSAKRPHGPSFSSTKSAPMTRSLVERRGESQRQWSRVEGEGRCTSAGERGMSWGGVDGRTAAFNRRHGAATSTSFSSSPSGFHAEWELQRDSETYTRSNGKKHSREEDIRQAERWFSFSTGYLRTPASRISAPLQPPYPTATPFRLSRKGDAFHPLRWGRKLFGRVRVSIQRWLGGGV